MTSAYLKNLQEGSPAQVVFMSLVTGDSYINDVDELAEYSKLKESLSSSHHENKKTYGMQGSKKMFLSSKTSDKPVSVQSSQKPSSITTASEEKHPLDNYAENISISINNNELSITSISSERLSTTDIKEIISCFKKQFGDNSITECKVFSDALHLTIRADSVEEITEYLQDTQFISRPLSPQPF